MKALVINHYAANKGDRAVLYFVLRELVRNGISQVTISAHDRSFWKAGLEVAGGRAHFVPWGQGEELQSNGSAGPRLIARLHRKVRRDWGFPLLRWLLQRGPNFPSLWLLSTAAFARALRGADFVIGTGGHHIQTRFTPESLSPMTYDMALAILSGKPVILWSQTIGPLDFHSEANKLFIRQIINSVRQVYLRDQHSVVELARIGARVNHVRQTYDSVIGLDDEIPSYKPVEAREPVVGLSVYSAESRPAAVNDRYVSALSGLINTVISSGYRVRIFPMEMRGAVADDRPCIEQLLKRVRRRDACEVVDRDLDTVQHLQQVAECRAFVGHKTHSQLFALAAGTPLVALAYHQKTVDFMMQYNLRQHCVLDSELSAEHLCRVFHSLGLKLGETAAQLQNKSRAHGEQVRKSFRELLRNVTLQAEALAQEHKHP